MREILFLAHRIPFPPDKGDKIRSWHLLEGLARRFRVHLGAFVDDPADWQHLPVLQRICGEVCLRPLRGLPPRLRAATSLITREAVTLAYYRDRRLAQWVRGIAASRELAGAFAYSSSMAQYLEAIPLATGARRILDLCDVDSDKWRQYAAIRRWPKSWIYAREARLLATDENRYLEHFDACLVIAEPEAALLRDRFPRSKGRIEVLPNGVDTGYFDPSHPVQDPFPSGSRAIVFTGAMDYHPNVDGVEWFAKEVFPLVRRRVERATFWIVGSKPAGEVRALARLAGITVTGRVPDVRPYLGHAHVVVAPLRIARGVQNKVLEAMAMARPVVATPNAVQGIAGLSASEMSMASTPEDFAEAVVRDLQQETANSVPSARGFVSERFGWDAQRNRLDALLNANPAPTSAARTAPAAPQVALARPR